MRIGIRGVLLLCAAILPEAVYAQAKPPQAPAGVVPQLQEVVVTAQRRVETIQKSSLDIQAISGSALTEAGVTQVRDLSLVAPGVQIGQGGAATQIFIRGVGDFSASQLANPGVAFNVDGIYVARPEAVEGNFYDVKRVEVVKGPQGTLYGRNSTGGAINVITNMPVIGGGVSGYVSVEAGNFAEKHTTGAINLPLSGALAIRGAFDLMRRNGYLSDGANDDRHEAGRIHLLFAPSAAVSILGTVDYFHSHGKGPSYALGSLGAAKLPGNVNPWTAGNSQLGLASLASVQPLGPFLGLGGMNFEPYIDNTGIDESIELKVDLGWATLTVLPAHRDFRDDERNFPGFSNAQKFRSEETTGEVRLNHDEAPAKWVAGVYYFNEAISGQALINQGIVQSTQANYPVNHTTAYAGFGQVTYSVVKALRIIGGVRYTSERHALNGGLNTVTLTPTGPAVSAEPFYGTATFDSTTWKAGFEYDLAPENMLYFTASTGFKSGGLNQEPALVPGQNVYQPETLTAYELGVRNRFLDQRLQVNAAIFKWDYYNHQESVITFDTTDSINFLTENAGDATITGASLDVEARVGPDDTLRAYGEYDHAKYSSFSVEAAAYTFNPASTACSYGQPHPNAAGLPVIAVNCAGFQLARDPMWTGSAGWQHRFRLKNGAELVSNASVQFDSSRWGAVDFTANERFPSYAVGNFDLSYVSAGGAWNFTGFVHNVSNAAVATGAVQQAFAPPAVFLTLLPPRTYGGRVTFTF